MTKLTLVLATLMIASSPVHAQVRLNGGADVGASYVLNPDQVTSEQVGENQFRLTPNLLNYPVTKWCVSKVENVFKTINKERACLKVNRYLWNPRGRSCRAVNITLDMNRAIATQSNDGTIVWSAAPNAFEILTVADNKADDTVDSNNVIRSEVYIIKDCK